ncbi:CRE-YARS-1 protein [Caenorhabditis remanei]|uniref:Tyrosine--tRNA ligase n=1 Tax=Caenorhabditis remanei TaxID=31234 RepID=E3M643_CAERE|nr:CRE-YARS-1 protein [Caenorhabditis remanei]
MYFSKRIGDVALKTVRERRANPFVDYIRDLSKRKPLQHSYPADLLNKYEAELKQLPPYVYAGFDPTAESLHVGNLLILVNLIRCQQFGLRPIALIGEFTASIGDPSGKKSERDLLGEDVVIHNSKKVSEQIRNVFANTCRSSEPPIVVNNNDWLGKVNSNIVNILYLFSHFQISLRDFFRECKSMQLGKMLRMKTIKSRLETGLSYTEFSYQTMQAYDWYTLSEKFGCRFQLGGYDQLGHLDFGAHYIKKRGNLSDNRFAAGVCFPILTDSAGNKLGKSEGGGALWLDPVKTSPFHFYQFFAQLHDDKAEELLLLFSLRGVEDLEELLQNHRNNLGKWIAQKELAMEVTKMVHGEDGLDSALRCTKAMFGSKKADLTGLSRSEILKLFRTTIDLKKEDISSMGDLANVTRQGNGKGYLLMQKGAFSVNGTKKVNPAESIEGVSSSLPALTDLTLVCWGKRDYRLVRWI